MKKLFLIYLVLIFYIFIDSKPLPDLKNDKGKMNFNPKPPYLSKEQKEHSKEYFDNLVLKGLKSDNLTKGFPPYLFYEKINYKEDILNRKNILDKFKTKKNR